MPLQRSTTGVYHDLLWFPGVDTRYNDPACSAKVSRGRYAVPRPLLHHVGLGECCQPKPPDGRRQATREPGDPEPLSVGPAAHTRPKVGVRWACHLTYT
jgi:hypothetical protein